MWGYVDVVHLLHVPAACVLNLILKNTHMQGNAAVI